jgi:hypothetical protein
MVAGNPRRALKPWSAAHEFRKDLAKTLQAVRLKLLPSATQTEKESRADGDEKARRNRS